MLITLRMRSLCHCSMFVCWSPSEWDHYVTVQCLFADHPQNEIIMSLFNVCLLITLRMRSLCHCSMFVCWSPSEWDHYVTVQCLFADHPQNEIIMSLFNVCLLITFRMRLLCHCSMPFRKYAFSFRMVWCGQTRRLALQIISHLRCWSLREGTGTTGESVTGGLSVSSSLRCWLVSDNNDTPLSLVQPSSLKSLLIPARKAEASKQILFIPRVQISAPCLSLSLDNSVQLIPWECEVRMQFNNPSASLCPILRSDKANSSTHWGLYFFKLTWYWSPKVIVLARQWVQVPQYFGAIEVDYTLLYVFYIIKWTVSFSPHHPISCRQCDLIFDSEENMWMHGLHAVIAACLKRICECMVFTQ